MPTEKGLSIIHILLKIVSQKVFCRCGRLTRDKNWTILKIHNGVLAACGGLRSDPLNLIRVMLAKGNELLFHR